MGRLQGKHALVTAAGQGIGKATALAFAREGAQVLAVDIDSALLSQLAGEANVNTQQVDVLDDAALAAAAGSQPWDAMANIAGIVHHGSILDCSDADYDLAMRLNVRSMFVACRAALPAMRGRGGSIINMSSVASSVMGVANRFAYGVSKAAVVGLTKSIAADFVGEKVRCNAICPGTVFSPSWQQRVRELAELEGISEDAAVERFVARQPMGRIGQPEEIAELCVYLASDESAYMTGRALSIDGNMSS